MGRRVLQVLRVGKEPAESVAPLGRREDAGSVGATEQVEDPNAMPRHIDAVVLLDRHSHRAQRFSLHGWADRGSVGAQVRATGCEVAVPADDTQRESAWDIAAAGA